MEKTTLNIQEKIGAIQLGLLRYKHNGKKITLSVKIAVNENNSLSIISDEAPVQKLVNKNVTLIQKDNENYMYIGGRISKHAQKDTSLLSVDITKACWYVRQTEGSVTWLQEKCVYMPAPLDMAS